MRFCKSCGSMAANDDKYCVICGAKIDEEPEKIIEDKPIVAKDENINVEKQSGETSVVSAVKDEPASAKASSEEFVVSSGNPNLHDEYVDISSFAPAGNERKAQKPKLAPKSVKKSETKVVNSVSDIESKTREVGSIKTAPKQSRDSQNDEFEDIVSNSKKPRRLSKRAKIAIIVGCAAVVLAVGVVIAGSIINSSGPSAEELYTSAQQKYKSEDYYGAIDDLSKCVEINTSDVDAYMLLADAYIATNREQEAASALEIGYRETGSTTIKTRLDALNEKLRVDNIYNSLVDEGNDAVNNRDYNLAITKFTAATEAKPDIAEPYILTANVYVTMKEYDKALEILQNGLDKVNDEQISSKIKEINNIVAKEKEEEEKRLEEERLKAEKEQKEKEQKEQEERERLEKQPVEFETKIDEKTLDYKEVNIFSSDARWVEFNNEGRDLPGIDYANQLVQKTLDSYYEFDPELFGVKDEKELYELVKKSKNVIAVTHCRITVTYNKNGILSFVIYKYYVPPTILGYKETVETHTIDLKTGSEYDLNHILKDSDNVDEIIKTQAELNNIEVNDQRISNAEFFLAGDSLIFYMKNNDWQYVEVPLPYSEEDQFAMQIEEDAETTYLVLQ